MTPALRDRLWSFKAMLLVAFATLIVGGLTGAALVALISGDDQRAPGPVHVRFEPGPPGTPYGPPGHERKPWKHPHFYWNDGTRPPDVNVVPPPPGTPRPPSPTEPPEN